MARKASAAHDPSFQMLHHRLVSLVLGFPLSIWLTGLLVYHLTGGHEDSAKYQVTMWSVPLLWTAIVGLSFMARSKRACWAWLLGANAVAAALVYAVTR